MKNFNSPRYYLLFAAVAVTVFLFSFMVEWYGDVLFYRFSFVDGKPVDSLGELIASQTAHYFKMNGRTWVHVLSQIFAATGTKTLFALCNALVYVLLVVVFVRYSCSKAAAFRQYVLGALLMLLTFDTCYIPNYQIGYAWVSAMCLIFLLLIARADVVTGTARLWPMVGMALAAFVAGSGNEAICLGIAGALCIELALAWKRYSLEQKILIAAFGLGTLLLCLSPATISRSSGYYRPPVYMMIYNLVISLRVFYVMAVLLAVSLWQRRVTLRKVYADNRLFINAALLMLAFNLVIGLKHNRQLFCIELASAVIVMRLAALYARPRALTAAVGAMVCAIYALKAVAVAEFNSDVRALRSQLEVSRGDIFIDLPHFSNIVHPVEYITYKDNLNLFFHTSALMDDIDNRGRFYLGIDKDAYDNVRFYPETMREALKGEVKNQWHCRDGVYLLLRDKKHPARFILRRELDVPFAHIALPPYKVVFDNAYGLDTDDYDVVVTSFPVPFMRPLDIDIQPIDSK